MSATTSLTLQAKLAVTAVAVGGTTAVAGLGTFGAFTSTTDASAGVSTGTVTIALGAAGTPNRLTIGASGLVPGDSLQRAATLTNTGSEALAALTLSTTATTSSLLDTGAGGLRLVVERCSAPWAETSPAANTYAYTCNGSPSGTSVVADRAVIGAALPIGGPALTAAGVDHLRVTVSLPAAANNDFQRQSSTLLFTFNAAQRLATDK